MRRMATHPNLAGGHAVGFGATARTDNWWVEPLVTASVFLLLSVVLILRDQRRMAKPNPSA